MRNFNFDKLNETEFEEFCFDLLKELGFINVKWRKGTGLPSSPADSGRDIECELLVKDVDNEEYIEKWFVECKHYKKGLPQDKIQGALGWAVAERPDKLLIIASNFLSNPCKDYLESYKRNNKPSFKIKYWELKELEELVFGKTKLLKKFNLPGEFDFIDLMHPLHLKYISTPQANTLNYFFQLIEKINPKIRDELFQEAYFFIISPKAKKPKTGKETIGELLTEKVNFSSFKDKCYKLKKDLSEIMLISLIINETLRWNFHFGNKFNEENVIEFNKVVLSSLKESLKQEKQDKEHILSFIKNTEDHIKEMPKRTKRFYQNYIFFCEEILSKLMAEDLLFDLKNKD